MPSRNHTHATVHPSEELLVRFQKSPDRLSPAERQSLQDHLPGCPACREEVKLLASFTPSLIRQWAATTEREAARAVPTSLVFRVIEALRSVALHPGFAYSLVLILCIPLVRSYFLPAPAPSPAQPALEETAPRSAARQALEEALRSPSRSPRAPQQNASQEGRTAGRDPQEAALAVLLRAYKDAYETREVESLQQIWQLDETWRDSLQQIFVDSHQLALLIDIDEQSVVVAAEGQQVVAPFTQAITILDRDGRLSTRGPFFCIADIRLNDTGAWQITALQEDPQRGGRCRPTRHSLQ